MEKKLWGLILSLQKSSVGRFFVSFVYHCGLVYIWNFFAYEKDRRHPTEEMRKSRKYFKENKERLNRNLALLSDSESKRVYKKVVRYRMTHDYHDRPKYNRTNQYFPTDIVQISGGGIKFVDCGAYNGDTIRQFQKVTKNHYEKIIAFEPDHENVKALRKTRGNIFVVEAAVYSEDTELFFQTGDGSSSKVSDEGIKIAARAIDTVAECHDATFIKMDIEGSEYQALLGARNTIIKNKPILAICIYHSDEDMIRILELIHSWDLGYRFYIRHHAQKISETVLYAIR